MTKFNDTNSSSNGLLQYINQLEDGIIGCEVGVSTAENLCQILEYCDNIKKMYAIDPYQPYQDWCGYVSEERIKSIQNSAVENLKSIEQSSKVEWLNFRSDEAVTHIENDSLDFIFIDGDHSYERAYADFCNFYPKIKVGGIFAGHDYSLIGVNQALQQFTEEQNIGFSNLIRLSNDSWMIYKLDS